MHDYLYCAAAAWCSFGAHTVGVYVGVNQDCPSAHSAAK